MDISNQDISFNKSFIENTLKQLKSIKKNIGDIKREYEDCLKKLNARI